MSMGSASAQNYEIPVWTKSNVQWWHQGDITDAEFVAALEHLISSSIIRSPQITIITDEQILAKEQRINDKITVPEYFKTNAKWWSDGIIDDATFLSSIEYLVEEEIINSPSIKVTHTELIPTEDDLVFDDSQHFGSGGDNDSSDDGGQGGAVDDVIQGGDVACLPLPGLECEVFVHSKRAWSDKECLNESGEETKIHARWVLLDENDDDIEDRYNVFPTVKHDGRIIFSPIEFYAIPNAPIIIKSIFVYKPGFYEFFIDSIDFQKVWINEKNERVVNSGSEPHPNSPNTLYFNENTKQYLKTPSSLNDNDFQQRYYFDDTTNSDLITINIPSCNIPPVSEDDPQKEEHPEDDLDVVSDDLQPYISLGDGHDSGDGAAQGGDGGNVDQGGNVDDSTPGVNAVETSFVIEPSPYYEDEYFVNLHWTILNGVEPFDSNHYLSVFANLADSQQYFPAYEKLDSPGNLDVKIPLVQTTDFSLQIMDDEIGEKITIENSQIHVPFPGTESLDISDNSNDSTDTDGDGIVDSIDTKPNEFSDEFFDKETSISGTIVDRAGHEIKVTKVDGIVQINVGADGGNDPAIIEILGVETELEPGTIMDASFG